MNHLTYMDEAETSMANALDTLMMMDLSEATRKAEGLHTALVRTLDTAFVLNDQLREQLKNEDR